MMAIIVCSCFENCRWNFAGWINARQRFRRRNRIFAQVAYQNLRAGGNLGIQSSSITYRCFSQRHSPQFSSMLIQSDLEMNPVRTLPFNPNTLNPLLQFTLPTNPYFSGFSPSNTSSNSYCPQSPSSSPSAALSYTSILLASSSWVFCP